MLRSQVAIANYGVDIVKKIGRKNREKGINGGMGEI